MSSLSGLCIQASPIHLIMLYWFSSKKKTSSKIAASLIHFAESLFWERRKVSSFNKQVRIWAFRQLHVMFQSHIFSQTRSTISVSSSTFFRKVNKLMWLKGLFLGCFVYNSHCWYPIDMSNFYVSAKEVKRCIYFCMVKVRFYCEVSTWADTTLFPFNFFFH